MRCRFLTTLRQLVDALNARGIGSARGGTWHTSPVRDLLGAGEGFVKGD
jgi:hypothetical protein